MREPKFKVGDKVRVINYGHLIWVRSDLKAPSKSAVLYKENKTTKFYDISPKLVGQEGIIDKVSMTGGIPTYSIHGTKGKKSWFNEEQVELIYRPDYTNLDTTEKVLTLFQTGFTSKTELSEAMGITRPTLDSRLEGRSPWGKLEVGYINRYFGMRLK